MNGNSIILESYPDILGKLETTRPNNNLLLGNGFNLSLGIKTDYKSIVSKMRENNQEYLSVLSENANIEDFIGKCTNYIADNPYSKFMKTYFHNKIKLDFMKAVTQIVSIEVRKLRNEKNEGIFLLLKKFDSFFTLNYDPFLYQLLMQYKNEKALIFTNTLLEIKNMMDDESKQLLDEMKSGYDSGLLTIVIDRKPVRLDLNKLAKADFKVNMREYFGQKYSKAKIDKIVDQFWKEKDAEDKMYIDHIDDGFRLFDGNLVFSSQDIQNVFFLHGAFHLYCRGKSIYKITQESEKALYTKIEEIVENAQENIICVFSDKNKIDEIVQNDYLSNAYSKLHKLEGSLVIIGCSLADNDYHIYEEINESKIENIFYASSEDSKIKDKEKAEKWFFGKNVYLFDKTTISYIR